MYNDGNYHSSSSYIDIDFLFAPHRCVKALESKMDLAQTAFDNFSVLRCELENLDSRNEALLGFETLQV